MNYLKLRSKLSIARKGINILLVICMLLIMGLAKPSEVNNHLKIIAKPILKPFFEQFQARQRDFTNIFNL